MYAWVYIFTPHAYSAHGGQERASYILELELQVVGSCLIWVLGTELRSLSRANAHNNCLYSPNLKLYL